MKTTLTVRLPEALVAQIEAESKRRRITKSDVVRERLEGRYATREADDPLASIRDLIGSVEGLPADVSTRTKDYLKISGYGRKRPR